MAVFEFKFELPFQASRAAERQRLQRKITALSQQQASQLVAEELLLEITRELALATAREYHYLDSLAHNMADQMCVREAGVMATGQAFGREDDDPLYPNVIEAFYASQRKRNAKRTRLWVHKQHMVTIADAEEKAEPEEPEDDDLQVIDDFDEFYPEHLKDYDPLPSDSALQKAELKAFVDYRREEGVYWNAFGLSTMIINLTKNTKGLKSLSVSPNDKFVAIGTTRGDVLVHRFHAQKKNAREEPQCVAFGAADNDPTIHVSWSRDSAQLASVSQLGLVSLWAFSAASATPEEAKQAGVRPDKAGVYPRKLALLHQQNSRAQDFRFLTGPLSGKRDVGDKRWAPTFAVFYPSFSMFGSQYSLLHGMTSNDLVMIDTEPLAREFGKAPPQPATANQEAPKKGRTEELPAVNGARLEDSDVRVGKEELRAAVFRAHKHPVIHVGFIRHVGDMLSVDRRGYIYVWKLRSEQMTENKWLRPFKKYRLAMKVQSFAPSADPPPLVRFDEAARDREDDDDGQKLKRERQKIEVELSKAGLRHPWIKEQMGGRETFIYRSLERVPESGAMFHEVSRAKSSKKLLKYQTRVYKPHKVRAELFLGCAQNAASSLLVSLLLFPPDERALPFLEVVIVDLTTMRAKEPRIQVALKKQQHQAIKKQGLLSFDVGRPLNATGAEYVFLNLLGELRIFSLATGQSVAQGVDPRQERKGPFAPPKDPSDGLRFNQAQFKIRPDMELQVASCQDHFFVLVFKKTEASVRVLQIANGNSEEAGRAVSDCFAALWERTAYPRELRLGGDNSFFSPEVHPTAGAREIIFRAMDAAIQKKAGRFEPEKKRAHEHLNRVHGYALLSDVIADQRKPLPYETAEKDD